MPIMLTQGEGGSNYVIYNLRLPGQLLIGDTFYSQYRDYDPLSGRYLRSDPIGLAGGINTYAYARANPLSYIDPRGLDVGSGELHRVE